MKMYVRQYGRICEYDTGDRTRYNDLTIGMRVYGQTDSLERLIDYIAIVDRYEVGQLPNVRKFLSLDIFKTREREEAIKEALAKGRHVYGVLSTDKGMVYATEMDKEGKWKLI